MELTYFSRCETAPRDVQTLESSNYGLWNFTGGLTTLLTSTILETIFGQDGHCTLVEQLVSALDALHQGQLFYSTPQKEALHIQQHQS